MPTNLLFACKIEQIEFTENLFWILLKKTIAQVKYKVYYSECQ
jgi:hypothetical protein